MILWRISNHPTLDGAGGLLASGRWHSRDRRVVCCAANPATALLEMLVHAEIDREDLPLGYQLIKIEVGDDLGREVVDPGDLPAGWRRRVSDTRAIGDAWLEAGQTALLNVPCAIVPETWNTLINPAHRDAGSISIVDVLEFRLDERLV